MIYGLSSLPFIRTVYNRIHINIPKNLDLKSFFSSKVQTCQSQEAPLPTLIGLNKAQQEKIYNRLLVNRVKEIQRKPEKTWTDEDLEVIELAEWKFKDIIIGSKKYKAIKEEVARKMEGAVK